MSDVAIELAKKLQTLDPNTAASVERLVRDALALAEQAQLNRTPDAWPPAFWEQVREFWGNEPFERPPQGDFDSREER